MALRFADGFDAYQTAAIAKYWKTLYNSAAVSISAGSGRNGTASLRLSSGWNRGVDKTIDSQATWILGIGITMSALPSATATIFGLYDNTTLHCDLRLTAGGFLQITRNGTVLGTGTSALSAGVYYYIEFKVTISDTVGVAGCRINGVSELALTSQDTRNGANATADTFRILGVTGIDAGTTINTDDFYACDGTGGGSDNDYLGDVRVEAIFPSGNGNSSQFLGSDSNSTDNYLLVDEATPNDDTDYVESSTVGDKDTYAYGNLTATSGTVYGVIPMPYARKTDAGVRSARQAMTGASSHGTSPKRVERPDPPAVGVRHGVEPVEPHAPERDRDEDAQPRYKPPGAALDADEGEGQQGRLQGHSDRRPAPHGAEGHRGRQPDRRVAGVEQHDRPVEAQAGGDERPRPGRGTVPGDDRADDRQRDQPPQDGRQERQHGEGDEGGRRVEDVADASS
jgi:hypothetical protein